MEVPTSVALQSINQSKNFYSGLSSRATARTTKLACCGMGVVAPLREGYDPTGNFLKPKRPRAHFGAHAQK